MDEQITWHVELVVQSGQWDAFAALTHAMVQSTQHESGVLLYERFISEDRHVVHVVERYVDSPAAVTHLQAFATMYGAQFASVVERQRFTVFGTPSPALKQLLDQFGAVYCPRLGGFSRVAEQRDGR